MLKFLRNKRKCNHNYEDETTTLKRLPRKTMVNPDRTEYVCMVCHKFFTKKK